MTKNGFFLTVEVAKMLDAHTKEASEIVMGQCHSRSTPAARQHLASFDTWASSRAYKMSGMEWGEAQLLWRRGSATFSLVHRPTQAFVS